MLRNNRGQIWTIIELLVVVAIIAVAGLWVARDYIGKGNTVKERVATPSGKALGVDCQNNLQQIRLAITMYEQSNEKWPGSIEELKSSGVTKELSICPITKKPYSYDPAHGRVWCTTPGHEKY